MRSKRKSNGQAEYREDSRIEKTLRFTATRLNLFNVKLNRSIVPLAGEIWKDISWTNGIYQVSNLGRVRRTNGWKGHQYCKILSPRLTSHRYPLITLKWNGNRKEKHLHVVIAEVFLGKRPCNKVINHKDGNRRNAAAQNLEYISQRENVMHAIKMGMHKMPKQK